MKKYVSLDTSGIRRLIQVMRLTLILSVLSMAQLTASSRYSQKKRLALHVKNVEVGYVLKVISEQSDFDFFYNEKLLANLPKVSLKSKNIKVMEIFKEIIPDHLIYEIVDKTIIIKKNPTPFQVLEKEDQEISGRITDENGEGIPGVTVLVKGTYSGTVTDVYGKYTIDINDGDILVFSFTGFMTQEVTVRGNTVIDISLIPDVRKLNEIIVTALGIERNKQSLSYAVSEVKGDAVAQKAEPDLLRALSGRVAGVNISSSGGASGSSTNIIIRGNNSATGNNQPLFVVDGIPFDNSFNNTATDPSDAASTYSNRSLDLDPTDVKSMTVLKGGAAAALYGSRASNGVIVITTYSGSQAQKGMEVELSNTIGFEQIARLPNYQNRFGQGNTNAKDAGRPLFSSKATESWGPEFGSGTLNGDLFLEDGITKYKNHLGDNVPYKAFPNNVKDFYETGSQRETAIRIRGGSATSGFAIVASNVKNRGFIPFTGLERTSIKTSGNTVLENGLDIGASMTYVKTHQDGILSGGHNTLSSINRQTLFIPRSYDLTGFDFIDPITGAQKAYNFWDNPRWLAQEGPYNSDVNRFYGNINLNYNINEWLNVAYRVGVNTYTDLRNQIIPRGSFFGPGNIIDHTIAFTEINSDLIITGSKDLGEDFNLRFTVGHNFNQRTTDQNVLKGTGIIKRGISRISNAETIVNNRSQFSQRKIIGVYADLTLNYKDWLFINATGRNDWSSTLPVGKRSFFYPSISAAFIFTEALGIQSNMLNSGKLRLAFSRIGNDADPYLLSTVNTINGGAGSLGFPFKGVSASTIGDNAGNLDLKPEFTNEFEIGTELKLLNNKLSIDFAYYDKITRDQIFSVNVPAATGFLTKTFNAGEISNKGVEIGLGYTPISNANGITWNVFANFSKNVSLVEKLADGVDIINPGFKVADYANVLKVGEPYGVFLAEAVVRDDEGNLLINPATGLTSKTLQQKIVGDPNPDFIVGVTNSLSFKGFSLGFLVDWKQGGDVMCLSCGYLRGFGITEETTDRKRAYILPGVLADPDNPAKPLLDGDGNKIPNDVQITPQSYWSGAVSGSTTNQYRFAGEAYVFDATTVRLREITLGYSIPKKFLKNIFIGSASISFIGRNLWFKAFNIPHIDPEVSTYGAGNAQGIEQYAPPTVKNYSVNIKFTF